MVNNFLKESVSSVETSELQSQTQTELDQAAKNISKTKITEVDFLISVEAFHLKLSYKLIFEHLDRYYAS